MVIFQLLNEAQMDLLNNLLTTESADTNDMKCHLLVVLHTGHKGNK